MKRLYIIIICICALAASAHGQGLVKEVEGIRDFDPDKRPATRLTASPQLLTPKIDATRLRFGSEPIIVSAGASITPMPPLYNGPVRYEAVNPGYAAVGYFPKGDVGASAGYRIIDRVTTRLDVWGQFNRNQFNGESPFSDSKWRMTTTDMAAGLNFAWRHGDHNILKAATSYAYDMFNYPGEVRLPRSQTTGRFRLNVGWRGRAADIFDYEASAYMRHGQYGKTALPQGFDLAAGSPRGFADLSAGAALSGRLKCSGRVSVELGAAYDMASRNRTYALRSGIATLEAAGGPTWGCLLYTTPSPRAS